MKVWTLRHKPTGRFMPCRMFKRNAGGWSYWNPHEEPPGYVPFDRNPRVFFTLQAARNARAAWAAGEWKRGMTVGGFLEPPEETHPHPHPVQRNRDDLEIVEGDLVLA